MNKIKPKLNSVKRFGRRNAPTLTMIGSILAGFLSLGFTIDATIKATREVDEMRANGEEPTKKEILKKVAHHYIPAGLTAASAVTLAITSDSMHVKREKALSAALVASSEAYQVFRKKVEEKVGAEEVKQIQEEQKKEQIEAADPNEVITVWDEFIGYSFNTTLAKLLEAELEVNRRLNSHNSGNVCNGEVSLNEFYRLAGAKALRSAEGYSWNSWDMLNRVESSWIDFTHVIQKVVKGVGNSDKFYILYYSDEPRTEYEMKIEY